MKQGFKKRGSNKDKNLRVLTEYLSQKNKEHDIDGLANQVGQKFSDMKLDGRFVPKGIGKITLLNFIYVCSLIYLNSELLDKTLELVEIFDNYANRCHASFDVKFEIRMIEARAYGHKGDCEQAMKIIEKVEGFKLKDKQRFAVLFEKGMLQSKQAKLNVRVNSLSEALGVAEKLGDEEKIADVYRELSYMFSIKYPALGLSLLRRGKTYYRRLTNLFETKYTELLMAQSCILIHVLGNWFYGPETNYFYTEGVRMLNTISREDLPRNSDKALYSQIYGIAHGDMESMELSLSIYRELGATYDVLCLLDVMSTMYSRRSQHEEAIRCMSQYKEMAIETGDENSLKYAMSALKILEMGGIGTQYIERRKDEPQTLLHILDKISFDEECEFFRTPPHRKRYVNPEDEGKCIPLENADGTLSLYPFCKKSFNYYRGQTRRFVPCKPSLHRSGMTPSKQYLERVRYAEFHLLIDTHPICEKYVNSSRLLLSSQNKDYKFRIYHHALAQHYGIATELIDLTADKWVAAFFAATDYEGGEYKVHTDTSEQGIFYICEEPNFKQLDTLPNPIEPKIKPIGIQPFPRPGEQRGYAYPMEPEEDFEAKVKEMIPFRHDPRINELVFNFANRSKRLFPDDVLKDKANTIKKSLTLSEAAYRMARQMFYPKEPQEQFDKWECEENMKHQNGPITAFSEEDIKDFRRSYPTFERELMDKIIRL